MLDSTIVTLALPAIREDLDASASGLQWVMNAYLLVIAALVVTAGRIGDMFGRRLLFTIGLAVFAGGSVLSGAAWSQDAIILGRVVQGAGAAMLLPLSLAMALGAIEGRRWSTPRVRRRRDAPPPPAPSPVSPVAGAATP